MSIYYGLWTSQLIANSTGKAWRAVIHGVTESDTTE